MKKTFYILLTLYVVNDLNNMSFESFIFILMGVIAFAGISLYWSSYYKIVSRD